MPRVAGRLTIQGNVERISVQTHLVNGLAVYFEFERLPRARTVVLEVDGTQVFRGVVTPSLSTALLEAAHRSRDFDRLTFATLTVARASAQVPWMVQP